MRTWKVVAAGVYLTCGSLVSEVEAGWEFEDYPTSTDSGYVWMPLPCGVFDQIDTGFQSASLCGSYYETDSDVGTSYTRSFRLGTDATQPMLCDTYIGESVRIVADPQENPLTEVRADWEVSGQYNQVDPLGRFSWSLHAYEPNSGMTRWTRLFDAWPSETTTESGVLLGTVEPGDVVRIVLTGNLYELEGQPRDVSTSLRLYVCEAQEPDPMAIDLRVDDVELSQSIPDPTGTQPFVAGKPVFARAFLSRTGPPGGAAWDAVLRLHFSGGVTRTYDSLNGPCFVEPLSLFGCMTPPQAYPADPLLADEEQTANFLFTISDTWAPLLERIEVEVNPCSGITGRPYTQIPESDFTNNTWDRTNIQFEERCPPRIKYVPVNVNGELIDLTYLGPGVADYMYLAMFPIPILQYGAAPWLPEIRVVEPSPVEYLKSPSFRFSLWVRKKAHTDADLVFGWSPVGDGIAWESAGVGWANVDPGPPDFPPNTPGSLNHQCHFAHEMGHLYGLCHTLPSATNPKSRIGAVGVDVYQPERGGGGNCSPCTRLKDTTKQSFMRATCGWLLDLFCPGTSPTPCPGGCTFPGGALWDWINASEASALLSSPLIACGGSSAPKAMEPIWLIGGGYDSVTSEMIVETMWELPDGELGPFDPQGQFAVKAYSVSPSTLLYEHSFSGFVPSDPDSASQTTIVPFGVAVPSTGADRIEIVDAQTGTSFFDVTRTANAPSISILQPTANSAIMDGSPVIWSGCDSDGDSLLYSLRYSWDGGASYVPLVMSTPDTAYMLDTGFLPGSDIGLATLQLIASDGMNNTTIEVMGLTLDEKKPPQVAIMASDTLTVRQGASFALTAAVSDAEGDLAPDDILWTRSGLIPLGVGRTIVRDDFPVGTHQVGVVVTDADNMTASDSVTVEVTPRDTATNVYGDEEKAPEIKTFRFVGVRPNPFNPMTTFTFITPERTRVEIRIYDIAGRLVKVLDTANHTAGVHNLTWDGKSDHGDQLASGVYVYKLTAGSISETGKIVLAR